MTAAMIGRIDRDVREARHGGRSLLSRLECSLDASSLALLPSAFPELEHLACRISLPSADDAPAPPAPLPAAACPRLRSLRATLMGISYSGRGPERSACAAALDALLRLASGGQCTELSLTVVCRDESVALPPIAARLGDSAAGLTSLCLSGFDLGRQTDALGGLPALRSLDVTQCCGDGLPESVVSALRAAPELETLELRQVPLVSGSICESDDEELLLTEASADASAWAKLPAAQLASLSLCRCGLDAAAAFAAAAACGALSHLEQLTLASPCGAADAGPSPWGGDVGAFFSPKWPLPALMHLTLQRCEMGASAWANAKRFAPALRAVTMLTTMRSFYLRGERCRTGEDWRAMAAEAEAALRRGGHVGCVVRVDREPLPLWEGYKATCALAR